MRPSHEHNMKGKISYLESPERRKEFSPEQLLNMIPLKDPENLLDFGAGTGYITIPAAKKVKGNVYALDLDPAMLKIIEEKALKEELTNIIPVQGSMEDLPIQDGSIDVIIASLVLHEVKPLKPLLVQMKEVLKKEGYLVCLEINPKHPSEKAPRISMDGLEQEMKEVGLHVTKTFSPSKSLYGLVAQKRD